MSNAAYYLLWLAAGLAAIAIASAFIARHLRQRVLRRLNAAALLAALDRYSEWVAAQRHFALSGISDQENSPPLQQMRVLHQRWFPELRAETEELLAVHALLSDFLSAQHVLRLEDPEAWLESEQDARFMDLWRQHLAAVHKLIHKLEPFAGACGAVQETGKTSPA